MSRTAILKKTMLAALEKSLGIVNVAIEETGINRCTHYRWLANDPAYKASVEDVENVALDFAETKLHKAINEGSVPAIIFYLKTKGKKRGYIERSELDINKIKIGVDLEEEEYI